MPQPRCAPIAGGITAKKNPSGSTLLKGVLVKLGATAHEVALCTAATDTIYGVVMNDIPAGEWGDIQHSGGKALVRGGAAVAIGSYVTADADGEGVVTTTNLDSYIGIAETLGADNELFEVALTTPGAERSA